MIRHIEASLVVSLSMERMFAFMKRYGHHYPVLYAINKGEPLDLSIIQNESIITVDSEDKADTDEPDKIYRSLVGFKLQGDEDEKNIQKVADEIVDKLNPDAVALVMACMYAEYDDPNAKIPDTLNDEPDACKVLHVCYWTREDPTARITQAPFETQGQVSEDGLAWASQEGNEVNYGLVAVCYPWTIEGNKTKPKILNPYRELRK